MLKQIFLLLFHVFAEVPIGISVFQNLAAFDDFRNRDIEKFKFHLRIIFEFMQLFHFESNHRFQIASQFFGFGVVIVSFKEEHVSIELKLGLFNFFARICGNVFLFFEFIAFIVPACRRIMIFPLPEA